MNEVRSSSPSGTRIPAVVYACSGCSDVGELADRTARRLSQECQAVMSCLSGLAAGHPKFLQEANDAEEIWVIDGCSMACASEVVQKYDLPFRRCSLHDHGLKKNVTPVREAQTHAAYQAAVFDFLIRKDLEVGAGISH